MVDRPSLIKALDSLSKPTSSQAENIRKLLEKALTDLVLALPLAAAQQLGSGDRAELSLFLSRLDPKALEKIAKSWEPKRKLDLEIKRTLAADLVALIEAKRTPYEPIKTTLEAARSNTDAVRAVIAAAPGKDLATVWKAWDKHNKTIPERRAELLHRLNTLLDGGTPMAPPTRGHLR